MSTVNHAVLSAVIAAVVFTAGIAAYEQYVRQPRTPRLAVIDIAKIHNVAQQNLKSRALGSLPGSGPGAATPANDLALSAALLREAASFGPTLEVVLDELADECRCAIVAMAAVYGDNGAMPDFTTEAARRMSVAIARDSAREPGR